MIRASYKIARLQKISGHGNTCIVPANDNYVQQTVLKKMGKSREKKSKKCHPRIRTLLDFKENFPDDYLQNLQLNVGTP